MTTTTSHIQAMRDYLGQLSQLYANNQHSHRSIDIVEYYRMILDRGEEFSGATVGRVEDFKAARWFCKLRKPQPRQCFYNAQKFAIEYEHEFITYYEGYATFGFFPVHHGWVVMTKATGEKVVIDHTWEAISTLKADQGLFEQRCYLGVPVPSEVIRNFWLEHESAEPCAQVHYLGSRARFLG